MAPEPSDPPVESQESREPSFWATMKWALVMILAMAVIVAITIPVMRYFD